jgi:hypothetical protein
LCWQVPDSWPAPPDDHLHLHAGGYVVYHPSDGAFELPAEQAMVVANEDSPVFLGGAFAVAP